MKKTDKEIRMVEKYPIFLNWKQLSAAELLPLAEKSKWLLLIIVLLCSSISRSAESPADTKQRPEKLTYIFPGSSVMKAATGGNWISFVKKPVNLKKADGITQSGYYYLNSTKYDVIGNGIKNIESLIKSYSRNLNQSESGARKRIVSLIKKFKSKIAFWEARRASLTPYQRFVNIYFTNAKLRIALLVRWYADEKTIEQVRTKAVPYKDNSYTHYETTVSRKLNFGDRGKYNVIALISKENGKVIDRVHWAYFNIGHYWVQAASVCDSAGPRGDIVALLRRAAIALGGEDLFTVRTPAEGVPAHPKNVTTLQIIAHLPDKSPLANTEISIKLIEPESPLIGGKLKNANSNGELTLKTDDNGAADFIFIPPDVDKAVLPKLIDIGRGKRDPIQQYLHVSSAAVSGAAMIKLAWPHPKIVSFATGSGVYTGCWGKKPALLRVSDIDSDSFTYNVIAVGKLRENIKLSPITDSKATWTGGGKLEFLYCPPKMGINLTDLPDLQNELISANLKFAAEYIDAMAKAPGIRKLVSAGGRSAVNISKSVIAVSKTGYSYTKYTDSVLNAGGPADSRKVAGFIRDTTALLNDMVSTTDSLMGGKMNPTVEMGKWILANLNSIEKVHGQNWKIATSYDDIVFLPIRVEVTDPEGHTTVIMRKVGVKFPQSL